MLMPTKPKSIKIALITLALLLMPLAESAMARGAGRSAKAVNFRFGNSWGTSKWQPDSGLRSNINLNTRYPRGARPQNSANRQSNVVIGSSVPGQSSFNALKHAAGSFDAVKHAAGAFDAKKHALGTFDVAKSRRTSYPGVERTRDRYLPQHNFRHNHRPWYHRVVRPKYPHLIRYRRGPYFTFRYFHPRHHRKYVFVSLGGYWPWHYNYLRYYWYGYHPYRWYGYNPVVYQIEGGTYNYYTYDDSGNAVATLTPGGNIRPVDENTFADVRSRLAEQAAKEPGQLTLADRYFENAVEAFAAADYASAANKLAEAFNIESDDLVLPFAYVQALFADRQYTQAAASLREALGRLGPDQKDVFFPRGLYSSDDILFEQIGRLAERAERDSSNTDLQLLLGYQLLGAGKFDRAAEQLRQIPDNSKNAEPAAMLLELLERINGDNAEDTEQ
jgi:hypothetical protein